MIKANELRIGNKIKFYNFIEPARIVTINARFFSSLAGGRSPQDIKPDEEINGYYSPIPLSGDILVKAGFENIHGEHCEQFRKGKILIELIPDGSVCIRLEPGYKSWAYVVDHIKSLHSFQNLIFALTGTELEINL